MLDQTDQLRQGVTDAYTDQPAIKAMGLTKTYGASAGAKAVTALDNVDLEIPRGSIFGLLGPNGAGKSTFINILAGLVIKSSGTANIWGFDIDANPRNAKASIGVVPQEIYFDPFFTPREMLDLQAGMYGVSPKDRRTDEILKALSLFDKRDAYSRSLSGGMKRRLLVGKAMVHNPPILILDEPTAGVDIELRRGLWAYVRELNARGVTIVLTTHYLEEAEELCSHIAIINKGEVAVCTTKDELMSRIDEKELVVTVDEKMTEVPAALQAMGAKLLDSYRFSVIYRRDQVNSGQIITQTSAAGLTILDVTTREAALEEIFLKLTSSGGA